MQIWASIFFYMFLTSAAYGQSNMFEKTKAQFDQGRLPTANEVTGWIVGRCFYSSYNDPDVPYAGILFGMTSTTGNPAGDLKVMISPPRSYALPADQFDNPDANLLQQLQDIVVDPYYDLLTIATSSDGYLHSELTGYNSDYRVRIFHDTSDPKNPRDLIVSIGVALPSELVRLACYHDKKIND